MRLREMREEKEMTRRMIRVSTLIAFAIVALTGISPAAMAGVYPAAPGDITVSVPFEFIAGGKALPAGEYILRKSAAGALQVCEEGIYCVTVQASVAPTAEAPAEPQLIFQEYSGRFVLTQVWSPRYGALQISGHNDNQLLADARPANETCIHARELCLHLNQGLAPAWH